MKAKRPAKSDLRELLRIDLREKYRYTHLSDWRGWDLSAQHRFVPADEPDTVMLSFVSPRANEERVATVLQSTDGGKNWSLYAGPSEWPPSTTGMLQYGQVRFALASGWEFRRSFDNGRTWSDSRRVMNADDLLFDGLGAPNCFSAIVLQQGTYAGRIVLAADYFLGQEGPDSQLVCSVYSDDWGDTWRASRLFGPPDPLPKGPEGFGEPAVVEMPSGWLWMVFRTVYGELWQAISRNGGASWGHPSPTGLSSPIANCYAAREPTTGATVLCWNLTKPGMSQDFRAKHSLYRPRTNLVFSVSRDNTRTWTCPVVVEPMGGFYPTIHFAAGRMFIMYQSSADTEAHEWHKYGLTLVAYDISEVLALPAWTLETIQPYIERGLVAHWRALACQAPSRETIS